MTPRLRGHLILNKDVILVHVHGNREVFYADLQEMGKKAEDYPYFKHEKSRTLSGIVKLPKPSALFENETLSGIFENIPSWKDLGAYIEVNSIDIALFCIAIGCKFTYPKDVYEIALATNATFSFEE